MELLGNKYISLGLFRWAVVLAFGTRYNVLWAWLKSSKISAKYGILKIWTEKHHPVSVPIPKTFVSYSVPFSDFSENTEIGG
jgi:hypothetical protein